MNPPESTICATSLGSSAVSREVVAVHVERKIKGTITFLCGLPGQIASNCRARVMHDEKTPAEVGGATIILAPAEKSSTTTKKCNRKKEDSHG
uniref:Uncharacterized protein n=1 Tax=Peronospora matthiolae TaxID=2874970 RepID=A0AAV1UNC6_9STRA